eukprot:scaffold907_cov398-Prasinococcus_capsulatus_cf.AAC.10
MAGPDRAQRSWLAAPASQPASQPRWRNTTTGRCGRKRVGEGAPGAAPAAATSASQICTFHSVSWGAAVIAEVAAGGLFAAWDSSARRVLPPPPGSEQQVNSGVPRERMPVRRLHIAYGGKVLLTMAPVQAP